MLSGSIMADNQELVRHQLAIPEGGTRSISFESTEDAAFLILSGQPINEPMSSYGPFVMNTPQELNEAIRDFQMGKMGTLA